MVPWANGLGTTAVVARHPDDDRWVWRVSVADVVSDGPFSSLPDVDRSIMVVSGVGMVLVVGDDAPVTVTPATGVFTFDGAVPTECTLLDGPVRDLNLMLRRGTSTGSLEVHSMEPNESMDVPGDVVVMVVLDGEVRNDGEHLRAFDAFVADGSPIGPAVALTPSCVAFARCR